MLVQEFLNKVALTEEGSRLHLFAFDAVQDEDTTELKIQSFAIVGPNDTVNGFRLITELHNHYVYSNECPCLIRLEHTLPLPTLQGEELNQALAGFAIQYQEDVIKAMIDHETTDELRDTELESFEAWDRQDLLEAPSDLSEVVNYTWLSRWSAVALQNHIQSWIHEIN